MAKATSEYRRLTRRKRTLLGYSQLWLGPGHILLVKSTRFAEEYQRFAFSDIQAIVVTRVPDRTVLQIAAAAAAIAWAAAMLAVSSPFAKGFFVITGALGLALAIADIARGPRCRCYLHTAVSRELLAPVSRERTAAVFLSRLTPAIEAVQGSLPKESVSAEPARAPDPARRPPEVPSSPGYLPETLFAIFLVNASLVLAQMRFPNSEAGNVLVSTFIAEIVILIVALIRRGHRDPRRFVYVLMVVAILCMAWDMIGVGRTVAAWFSAVMESARRQSQQPPVFRTAFSDRAALFAYGWRFAAGLIGLAAAFYERRKMTPKK